MLGENQFRQAKFAEAEALDREVMKSRSARLPPENEEVVGAAAALARCLSDWAWAERPAEIQNSKPENPARAREAEKLLRDALAIRAKSLHPADRRLAETRSRLGGALLTIAVSDPSLDSPGRAAMFTEAEKLLIDGNDALQKGSGASVRVRRDALERLVRLYEAWDAAAPNTGKATRTTEWKQAWLIFEQTSGEKNKPLPQTPK